MTIDSARFESGTSYVQCAAIGARDLIREQGMNDDRDLDLARQMERDEEHEPRPMVRRVRRRKQLRYWSGAMFRPAKSPDQAPRPEVFS